MSDTTPFADILAIHADLAARNPLHPARPDSPYADPVDAAKVEHDALGEAVNLFGAMLNDRAHGNRCRATAPAPFAQAGAQCEREPHPTPNHRVSPRDGLPGAVWSDARSREGGGS